MKWGDDPYTHPEEKDLPLELQEKISRYEALNTYTNFTLGVGIDFNLYMNDEMYRNIVNQNFDEITPGNEMKQSSLMDNNGNLNFSNVDLVIDALKTAGLTIYGHTLVWHSQQQAIYLNNLIKPTIIPGAPGESLIVNGGFETGLDGWTISYYAEAVTQSDDFFLVGAYAMKVVVGDFGGSKYNMQINSPNFPIIDKHRYEISFFIKSDVAGSVGLDFDNNATLGEAYPNVDGAELVSTSSAWSKVTYNPTTVGGTGMTATADGEIYFRLLLGAVKNCTYYIDAVEVIDLDAEAEPSFTTLFSNLRSGPVTIEKSDEEKAEIIGAAMESWISEVVGHYKDDVLAWDVVNEPMNDSGNGLKTGIGKTLNANEFYWQDYLGKDYAVNAFKRAREAGGENVKLFINDYGLESASGDKLDGLLEYVAYIEQKGGKVDGIGTQMHLNINWSDKAAIETMFQKLGASGKLIKISELDIATANSSDPESPVSPTAEQYAGQADLYQYVVDMYMKHIPEAQRYGITVWSVSDNEKEHQYWLKNDAPCLWNVDYARKHAYKGFADGLAGKDVSADFSGALDY
jgi:GH35 family endo-1,4-beta-xylanase